jgi:hypothetical protein
LKIEKWWEIEKGARIFSRKWEAPTCRRSSRDYRANWRIANDPSLKRSESCRETM